jgi:hypothetical protein
MAITKFPADTEIDIFAPAPTKEPTKPNLPLTNSFSKFGLSEAKVAADILTFISFVYETPLISKVYLQILNNVAPAKEAIVAVFMGKGNGGFSETSHGQKIFFASITLPTKKGALFKTSPFIGV